MSSGLTISAYYQGKLLISQTLNPVNGQKQTFGRGADNTVVLPWATVSSHHGYFVWSNNCWYLLDTQSRNGIFFNGKRITGAVPVLGNCVVTLGSGDQAVELLLTLGESSAQSNVSRTHGVGNKVTLLILDRTLPPRKYPLDCGGKVDYTFGRYPDNSIQLNSSLVSAHHGMIRVNNGRCFITDNASHNGLMVNQRKVSSGGCELRDGDIIRIDSADPRQRGEDGVMIVVAGKGNIWKEVKLAPEGKTLIGRAPEAGLCVPHPSVSRRHAAIYRQGGVVWIEVYGRNSTLVNGVPVSGKTLLPPRSVITLATVSVYFAGDRLLYAEQESISDGKGNCCQTIHRFTLSARDLTRDVSEGRKSKRILNNVNLTIQPGEFVAIVGGSGCGKSTLLNALTGYDRATGGEVFVGEEPLYLNYDHFKSIIGYVPQQDIIYDYLTLRKMLEYTARMRMPEDTTEAERTNRVSEVLKTVELNDFSGTMVKKLSGGQKKRASIAVELLADPGLLFLDEPTSGLDPGTERNLMYMLRTLASEKRKTVIMVTHTTLNLHLCDKIIFMGKGGYLCFCGSTEEALEFFHTDNLVEIYNLLNEDTDRWHRLYVQRSGTSEAQSIVAKTRRHKRKKPALLKQMNVLAQRYMNLILNDWARLFLLLLEPILLGVILKVCASDAVYDGYVETKNMLFTYSCCAIWIGIFNSIQEICKERVILKREYMANLRLDSYIMSKFFVQALLCLVQTIFLFFTFALLVGLPEEGFLLDNPIPEMLLTTYFTVLASSSIGLIVSALSNNADKAMTLSPFLLVIQLVFAGIIFKLEGVVDIVSNITISRWAMCLLGMSVNMDELYAEIQENNDLLESITGEEVVADKALELFERVESHMYEDWLILIAFCVVCCVLSAIVLRRVRKDSR